MQGKHREKIMVFYDANCSLCSKEINHYRKLDKEIRILWCDIKHSTKQLKENNITYDNAMRELHAIDREGHILIGVDAFLLIWQELRHFSLLAKIVRGFRITSLLRFTYKHFATWRYQKQLCAMSVTKPTLRNQCKEE